MFCALVTRLGTEAASQYVARRWGSLLFLAIGTAFMVLIGRDPAALLALRSPIAQAMGIELPEPAMAHAAVVA